MSRRVHDHAAILKILHNATPARQKNIIHTCDKELLECLSECAKNVLKGNVPLTAVQKQSLSRHRNNLRKLVLKTTTQKHKKKILQTGGFLGALVTPILSLLGGLFNGAG